MAGHAQAATRAPITLWKARRQMCFQERQNLGLRIFTACFGHKHLIGLLGMDAPLLGELEIEGIVDLDPVVQVERLQADGEELRRAVIGRVGRVLRQLVLRMIARR